VNRTVRLRRVLSPAERWTFRIPAVAQLITKYVPEDGKGWIDPFCGRSTLAEYRNDLDPESPCSSHNEAEAFVRAVRPPRGGFRGVLWDPPYSYRQISDCYHALGKKAHTNDTNSSFYTRVRAPLLPKLAKNALVLYCGWDTIPFGPGFEVVEGLDICHGGGHRHDTLVTVQRRVVE
jgi:hypothetical protein